MTPNQQSVHLTDVTPPEPSPHELVLDVHAYSVNRGETFQLEGDRPGWRPGKDVAGTVRSAASSPGGPQPGTRIVAHVPEAGWAEQVVVGPHEYATLPDGVNLTTAAALPLAGLTALRLLRTAGSLVGRSVLMTGASGGVGHYLSELAVRAGAEVTGVVADEERGARLRELGASTVTDAAHLSHRRFDVAIDSVGGDSLAAVRRLVSPGGRLLWLGQASREPATIDFFDWVDGDIGAPIEQFSYAHPSRAGDTDGGDLATLVHLVATGRLHPELGRIEPWEHTAEVIEDLRTRRIRGNAVLEIT